MLAAIAGLAAATFHAVVQAQRAATRAARHDQAASAAEAGLGAMLASWDVAGRDSQPIGAVDSTMIVASGPPPTRARLFVIRLTRQTYWIASVGEAAAGTAVEAVRAHNLLAEVLRPTFPDRAALMSRAAVVAGRDASITGDDAPPPGWTDCPPPDTVPAASVLIPHGETASYDDGRPLPGAKVDSAAADSAGYQLFGSVAAWSLADRATIVVAPGAILSPSPDTGRDCQPSGGERPAGSWGEPARSGTAAGCERFYPVVRAAGDLTVTRGRGQGLLLVAGRLRIEGPFTFHGVILADGGIDVTGSDVLVYGAVLSPAAQGVIWRGGGELRRSTCALNRVADAAARPYAVPLRPWSELF
jgi:hypothetical protein